MERDILIDSQLKELKEKKELFEKELKEIPEFKTNLMINRNDNSNYSLRTCSTINDCYEAYKIIHEHDYMYDTFNKLIEDSGEKIEVNKVAGYSVEDWDTDIHNMVKKIVLNSKIKSVNEYIVKIEKFYSGDRKEENAFNNLLNDIKNI